jgi:hypothetical protein
MPAPRCLSPSAMAFATWWWKRQPMSTSTCVVHCVQSRTCVGPRGNSVPSGRRWRAVRCGGSETAAGSQDQWQRGHTAAADGFACAGRVPVVVEPTVFLGADGAGHQGVLMGGQWPLTRPVR